ncbi:MAG: kinase-like domain-containing protein [Benjaminiella poitrasii]|nr:MAG: kinase-like domain-containing protein [Benjaminiella poitrasii]
MNCIQTATTTITTDSFEAVATPITSRKPVTSFDTNILRYLPQNQAVITTQDNWRISLLNQIATMILSGSQKNQNEQDFIGKHILDFIDVSYRPLLLDKIVKIRDDSPCSYNNTNTNGTVLICGDVMPIVKQDGTKSSASLWLKEKKNENGSSIFIWIFEEVFQSTIKISLTEDNLIQSVDDDDADELFGYTSSELVQQPIQTLIPKYDKAQKFFGCRTKRNAYFPVMIGHFSPNQKMIRITSMPTLAGLVTVDRKSNRIQSTNSNTAFCKYLFGYENMDGMSLAALIPLFPHLIHLLERDGLLDDGYVLNDSICRQILSSDVDNKPITARHRDGTEFEISMQIKLLNSTSYALWIAFDRDTVFSRYGHTTSIYKSQQRRFEKETTESYASTAILPAKRFHLQQSSLQNAAETVSTSVWPRVGEYSAQTLKTNINDYEIVDELGQGAYGIVKLAYLKTDPQKKRVVIKYVIKSRILVDCWTRDRRLGLIPAEIHVLHTLRKIPHTNCSDMLDYFEDEDNYYVVMDLYGAGMDLFDYIELKEGGMTEGEIRDIFHQIAEAVGHLHDHRIVHRDIKDENVILDLNGGVRLIDFGSAAYLKEGRQYETFVGTLDYAAPEILKGRAYSGPPQDIWACGTLLYTLIYRENPFYNIEEIMERELRIPFVMSEGKNTHNLHILNGSTK